MSQNQQQHNQHNIKEFNPYTFYFVNAIDNHDNIDAAAIYGVGKCYDANGNFVSDKTLNDGEGPTCNVLYNSCDSEEINDRIGCLTHAYYKNKEQALKYLEATNQDVGSEQKYLDMKADYNEELINSMNLTLGSIVLAGFIIKNLFYP
jgi:hypothetical protein